MFRLTHSLLSLFIAYITVTLVSQELCAGELSSYATSVQDVAGVTGSASAALGQPDYIVVNGPAPDGGIAQGFDVGESAVFSFAGPLHNVPEQDDLVVSVLVGGQGSVDNTDVLVEVSCDGANFLAVSTIEAAAGLFEEVRHFSVDFETVGCVMHVRLTNMAGTVEGLRLDAIEGIHPVNAARHAFELRIERYREDASERFLIRLKNIGDSELGVSITGLTIGREPDPTTGRRDWMEETANNLFGTDGEFFATIGRVGDADGENESGVAFAQFEWSVDGGVSVAPQGIGLDPGESAAHLRYKNLDIDTRDRTFLEGFEFSVIFSDGFVHRFNWDNDVVEFGQMGAIYQRYGWFSSEPELSGPRPTHYYEFSDDEGDSAGHCSSCVGFTTDDDADGGTGGTEGNGSGDAGDGGVIGDSADAETPRSVMCGGGVMGSLALCLMAMTFAEVKRRKQTGDRSAP